MKAIYYVRVSTGSQSYERQISDIKEYCIEHKIDLIPDAGFEEVESGKVKVRPVLTKMEKYIEENSKNIDFVIISELSRLGRTSKVLETVENLNKKNIGLVAIKEKISTLTTEKKVDYSSGLLIAILTAINGYELETTKYRSKSGIAEGIKSGRAGGSLNFAYGYTKIGLKKENKLVINPEEVDTIKLIFDLYLSGKGTKIIANTLNEKGTETRTNKINKDYKFGKKWVDGTIYSILKNPIYTGKRRRKYNEYLEENRKTKTVEYELLDFPELKIIEPEQFEQVQTLLKSNYNKLNKHNKYEYLLEPQKIICGCCSTPDKQRHYYPHKREDKIVDGVTIKGKDNTYKCISKRYNEPCENVGINIDKIEYFIQQIVLFLFEDKLMERLDNKTIKIQIDELTDEIIQIRKELDKAKKKGDDIYNDKLEGVITLDRYIKYRDENEAQQKLIETKLDNKLAIKFELNSTYENLKDIKKLKLNFHKGNKIPKDVINKIISKITLTKTLDFPSLVFRNQQDNILEMKILSIDKEYRFLISQRTYNLYYYFNNDEGILMNMFMIDRDDKEENVEKRLDRIKKFYEFVTIRE